MDTNQIIIAIVALAGGPLGLAAALIRLGSYRAQMDAEITALKAVNAKLSADLDKAAVENSVRFDKAAVENSVRFDKILSAISEVRESLHGQAEKTADKYAKQCDLDEAWNVLREVQNQVSRMQGQCMMHHDRHHLTAISQIK